MNTNIKYIVTDHCYILSDETWDKCCKIFKTYKDDEFMYQRFDEAVSKALTDLTGYPAFACDTGFGDWSNNIYGPDVIKSDFYADAGMVCVCRLTDEILQHLQEKYGKEDFSGMAIFEMSEDISIEFDVSDKNWTVVIIKDNKTGDTITSSESESNLDEEDDYDSFYDEDEDY